MKLDRDIVVKRLNSFNPKDSRRSNEDAEAPGALEDQNRNPWIKGEKPLKPAAVLVPLVVREDGMTVLLTRRTEHLNHHAGQISFPGGKIDDGDKDSLQTALRETEEEIGLARRHVEVVGRLNDYIVGTGFLVSPIIGLIEPPFELTAEKDEVAEIFEAPLEYLLNPKNIERHARDFRGARRHFFAITWKDYYIWGATAGMLRDLSERLWRDG